jgi:enoyl-CoA hydratase
MRSTSKSHSRRADQRLGAYEVGFANWFVPDGPELDEAIAMANKIVDLVPLALATMKRFVSEHILPEGPSELAARFAAELSAVQNSEDAAEGVRAFEERRRPQYKGL